jgi:hypothetical protein
MKITPFVLSKKTKTPTASEWRAFRKEFGAPLPAYEEFMNTLGEGIYSTAVRVYPPSRILAEISIFRNRWQQYFNWAASDSDLSQQDLIDAVVLGDSFDGDEIVTTPTQAGVFILPRHRDRIVRVGDDFDDAITYICDSGEIYTDTDFHYFETVVDRVK